MSDPFVQPEETSAAEAIEAIKDELSVLEDMPDERYHHIMDIGRRLPAFPSEWQDEAHFVPGCQAKVWMESVRRDGHLYFAAASNARIVAGLVALLLRIYSGRTPAEILATDPSVLRELGILQTLSTNRGNGVASMARRIRDAAAQAQAQGEHAA